MRGQPTRGSFVKFTIQQSAKNGQFWFRIVAPSGQILATSEMYEAKASARGAIESIQAHSGKAPIVDET